MSLSPELKYSIMVFRSEVCVLNGNVVPYIGKRFPVTLIGDTACEKLRQVKYQDISVTFAISGAERLSTSSLRHNLGL